MKKHRVHITLFVILLTVASAQIQEVYAHAFFKNIRLHKEDILKSSIDKKVGDIINQLLPVSYLFSSSDIGNEMPSFEKEPFYTSFLDVSTSKHSFLFIAKLAISTNFVAIQKSIVRLFPFHSFW